MPCACLPLQQSLRSFSGQSFDRIGAPLHLMSHQHWTQTTDDKTGQTLCVCDWVSLNVHVRYLVMIKAFLTQGVMLWAPPTWRGPRRWGTEFVSDCDVILLLSAMMLRTQEPRCSSSPPPEFTSMTVSPKCKKPSCDTDKLT